MDFINEVIPYENFLLAGESYGGYLARGIVHKIANRIDGLFLLCPAIEMQDEKRNVPAHVVLKKDYNLLSELDPADAESFNLFQVIQSKEIWNRYRNEILSGVKLADHEFLKRILEVQYGAFSFDPNQLEEEFIKPTLILLGRQDWCVGYKDA